MTAHPPSLKIKLPLEKLAEFCRRWRITALGVFGSALREDFGPESDLDLLATYEPEAPWSLLDRVRMQRELEEMLGHKVDLLSRRALEKSRRASAASILSQSQLLYAQT
jgi:predicted nucleotidyltransferase